MIEITADDAFALALIAQRPAEGKDLVKKLSTAAKPIGLALVRASTTHLEAETEVAKAAELLKSWARQESSPQVSFHRRARVAVPESRIPRP